MGLFGPTGGGGGAVSSVNGQVGAVVLGPQDLSAQPLFLTYIQHQATPSSSVWTLPVANVAGFFNDVKIVGQYSSTDSVTILVPRLAPDVNKIGYGCAIAVSLSTPSAFGQQFPAIQVRDAVSNTLLLSNAGSASPNISFSLKLQKDTAEWALVPFTSDIELKSNKNQVGGYVGINQFGKIATSVLDTSSTGQATTNQVVLGGDIRLKGAASQYLGNWTRQANGNVSINTGTHSFVAGDTIIVKGSTSLTAGQPNGDGTFVLTNAGSTLNWNQPGGGSANLTGGVIIRQGIIDFPIVKTDTTNTFTGVNNFQSGIDVSIGSTAFAAAKVKQNGAGVSLLVETTTNSTNPALKVVQLGSGEAMRIEDESPESTPFVVSGAGKVGIGIAPDASVGLSVDSTGIKFADSTTLLTGGNAASFTIQDWSGDGTTATINASGHTFLVNQRVLFRNTGSTLDSVTTDSVVTSVSGNSFTIASTLNGSGFGGFVARRGLMTPIQMNQLQTAQQAARSINISSWSANGTTATIAATNHGFFTNDAILITGTGIIDGTYTITQTGADTFTIPIAVTATGTTGVAIRSGRLSASDKLLIDSNRKNAWGPMVILRFANWGRGQTGYGPGNPPTGMSALTPTSGNVVENFNPDIYHPRLFNGGQFFGVGRQYKLICAVRCDQIAFDGVHCQLRWFNGSTSQIIPGLMDFGGGNDGIPSKSYFATSDTLTAVDEWWTFVPFFGAYDGSNFARIQDCVVVAYLV